MTTTYEQHRDSFVQPTNNKIIFTPEAQELLDSGECDDVIALLNEGNEEEALALLNKRLNYE